jgi:hypothetical protein
VIVSQSQSNQCSVHVNTSSSKRRSRQADSTTRKKVKLGSGFLESFDKSFRSFDDSQKWKLSTGEYVEDILHKYFIAHEQEHSAHSWVIDIDDPVIKKIFAPGQLDEIYKHAPELPEKDEVLAEYLKRFISIRKIFHLL